MLIRYFSTPGLAIHSFLVIDESSRKGALIDPTPHIQPYLAAAAQEGVKITDILETHVHADFISGAVDLKAALGGKAAIHCSGMGGKGWTPVYADKILKNRDVVSLGDVRFEAWHTPGHTPEHVIWVAYDEKRSKEVPQAAFTGDLLFVGSVGRPDLLGPEAEKSLSKQLYETLFKTLEPLPDSLEVFPSHGAGSLCGKNIGAGPFTTLGYERKCNPGLTRQPYEQWFTSLHQEMPASPDYFSRLKKENIMGPDISRLKEAMKTLTQEQVKTHLNKAVFIDARRPDEFSLMSLPGAVNIPLAPMFPLWAGIVLDRDKESIVVVEKEEDAASVIQGLRLVGIDRIAGVCALSQWTFEEKKELLKPAEAVTVEEIYTHPEKYYVIDVRSDREWSGGHIEGAHHHELSRIMHVLDKLPTDQPIGVVCHSGNRASVVASLLARRKGAKAFNVRGGMQEWLLAGYPVKAT